MAIKNLLRFENDTYTIFVMMCLYYILGYVHCTRICEKFMYTVYYN